MADALDLAFRLPRTWRLVRAGRVALWLARAAAQEARDLNADAAGHADRLLEWQAGRLNPTRVRRLVDEAQLYLDPDRAAEDERHARERRGVEVRHDSGAPGTSQVVMTLDTADASAFDDTVGHIARELGDLGDGDALAVRRARAVGVLADPQRALRFTTGTATLDDGYGPVREDARSAVLYLHLDASDLRAGALTGLSGGAGGAGWGGGVVRSETLGPMLTEQLHAWLLGSKVVVRPVLDLRRQHPVRDAVDAHDPPEWMAELVRLRDPWCVHPGCGRESRSCDLDQSRPTARWTRAARPVRPTRATSPRCADGTTARRRSAPSPTAGSPTGPTSGPCPPAP